MSMDDTQLLRSWQSRRDAQAFQTLTRRYGAMVYGTCLRILRNSHDAEEVVQDCFFILAQAPARVGGHVGPWLHRVATNRALDRRKAELRRAQRDKSEAAELVTHPQLPEELLPHVDAAIAALPQQARSVVVAYFLEGRTQLELAQSLGISQQAVSQRINKGVEGLRRSLKRSGIIAAPGVLAGALAETANASIPPALAGTLSKIGLTGLPAHLSGTSVITTAVGGILMKKSLAAAVVALIAVSTMYFVATRPSGDAPAPEAKDSRARSAAAAQADTELRTPLADTSGASDQIDISSVVDALAEGVLEPGEIADPKLYASVSGTVISMNGRPIAGARVALIAPGIETRGRNIQDSASFDRIFGNGRHDVYATTDRNGRYTLEAIRFEGRAYATASAEGFRNEDPQVGVVQIQAGDAITGIDFMLVPGWTLFGIVVNPRGRPLAGATIFAGEAGSVKSTQDGTFNVPGPVGRRTMDFYVYHDDYGRASFENVTLVEGEALRLTMAAPASLSGLITRADGVSVADYRVRLFPTPREGGAGDVPLYYAGIDQAGAYYFDAIESGNYNAEILSESETSISGWQDLGELASGKAHTWNFEIDTAMRVHGVVRGATSGTPLPGRTVVCSINGAVAKSTTTDAAGAYSMEVHPSEGQHMIAAAATRLDTEDLLTDLAKTHAKQFTVEPGKERTIDLELPDPFAAAAFFVDANGAPVVEGIRVVLNMHDPKTGRSAPPQTVQPEASGRYYWEGIQPGLRATFNAWPEDGSPYIFARTPDLKPAAKGNVHEYTVRLHEQARMEGRVLRPNGKPLRGGYIWANLELEDGGSYGPLSADTSWNGYFKFEEDPSSVPSAVPAAAFTMILYHNSEDDEMQRWRSGTLNAGGGETLDLGEIRLAPIE